MSKPPQKMPRLPNHHLIFSTAPALFVLIFIFTHPAAAQKPAKCYFPDKSEDTALGLPCNATAAAAGLATPCCIQGDVCFESGICVSGNSDGATIYRQSCADREWGPGCSRACREPGFMGQGRWIQICDPREKTACCMTTSGSCCDGKTPTFKLELGAPIARLDRQGRNLLGSYVDARGVVQFDGSPEVVLATTAGSPSMQAMVGTSSSSSPSSSYSSSSSSSSSSSLPACTVPAPIETKSVPVPEQKCSGGGEELRAAVLGLGIAFGLLLVGTVAAAVVLFARLAAERRALARGAGEVEKRGELPSPDRSDRPRWERRVSGTHVTHEMYAGVAGPFEVSPTER